jgi:phosphotransferase system enzyme I (PtsI)
MAGDPTMTLLLLGMGIDQLSMASVAIPEIKQLVTETTMQEARELAREALSQSGPAEVRRCVTNWMTRLFPGRRFESNLSMHHLDS